MSEQMIHFVCENETDKIIRIYFQRKRADRMMDKSPFEYHVLSVNPKIYEIENLKVGDKINEVFLKRKV